MVAYVRGPSDEEEARIPVTHVYCVLVYSARDTKEDLSYSAVLTVSKQRACGIQEFSLSPAAVPAFIEDRLLHHTLLC